MKVVGIIAEYNPFHNGHKYHIEQSKRSTGADYCIVIMSGDYVQRGEPAVMDKYARAKAALNCGADLVLELPTCFSCSSAEYFAGASVAILDKLNVVTDLSFGSESGDIDSLYEIASVITDEPREYKEALNHNLRMGRSYPFARALALSGYMKDNPQYMNILSSPNNILAIEYIKALKKRKSQIRAFTITRKGAEYHDSKYASLAPGLDNDSYPSALSLRTALNADGSVQNFKHLVPDSSFEIMQEKISKGHMPLFTDNFSLLLNARLLELENEGYEKFLDVSKELSNKIQKELYDFTTFSNLCEKLKSKDITYTRVSRALLHIMLGITKEAFEKRVSHDYVSYANILGFKEESSALLSAIKKNSQIPLVSKNADAHKIISPFEYDIFEETIRCSHIYQAVLKSKYKSDVRNMYRCTPVIIK